MAFWFSTFSISTARSSRSDGNGGRFTKNRSGEPVLPLQNCTTATIVNCFHFLHSGCGALLTRSKPWGGRIAHEATCSHFKRAVACQAKRRLANFQELFVNLRPTLDKSKLPRLCPFARTRLGKISLRWPALPPEPSNFAWSCDSVVEGWFWQCSSLSPLAN